jgi:regulatory protein
VGASGRTPRGTAKDRALGLLAVRWRSRVELERRLVRAGYEPDEVRDALIDLERAGLVDDERFAREVVRSKATGRLAGPRAVREALRTSGVDAQIAEHAMAEAAVGDSEADEARATALAQKRATRMAGIAPDVAARRLFDLLVRRGYGPDVARLAARTALSEAFQAPPDEGP